MLDRENLSSALAYRQKRLQFLREKFHKVELSQKQRADVIMILQMYANLLSKCSTQISDTELEAAWNQLLATERELITLFDTARLATSELYASTKGSSKISQLMSH